MFIPSFPFTYLLIHSFIQSFVYNHLFGLQSNTTVIYFVAQIVPVLAIGGSFRLWLLSPLRTHTPLHCLFLAAFYSGFLTVLQAHPVLPCPNPGTSHFSSLRSFSWRRAFRNYDVGFKCALCSWSVTLPLSRQS